MFVSRMKNACCKLVLYLLFDMGKELLFGDCLVTVQSVFCARPVFASASSLCACPATSKKPESLLAHHVGH